MTSATPSARHAQDQLSPTASELRLGVEGDPDALSPYDPGNLTLTGYNSIEYDKPFLLKRDMLAASRTARSVSIVRCETQH